MSKLKLTKQASGKRKSKVPKDPALSHGQGNLLHFEQSLKRNPDFFFSDHYQKRLVKQKGFEDYGKYLDWLAQSKGFANASTYYKSKLAAKGIHSATEHQELLASKLGLETTSEYQSYLKTKRAQNPRYTRFAAWLNQCLVIIQKDYHWLANKLELSDEACRQYILGFSIPRESNFVKIRYFLAQYALPTVRLPEPPKTKRKSFKTKGLPQGAALRHAQRE